jgi:hypothetical protein
MEMNNALLLQTSVLRNRLSTEQLPLLVWSDDLTPLHFQNDFPA